MTRRLIVLTCLTVVLASLLAWPLSHRKGAEVQYFGDRRSYGLWVSAGAVALHCTWRSGTRYGPRWESEWEDPEPILGSTGSVALWNRAGFGWFDERVTAGSRERVVSIVFPLWFVALPALATLILITTRHRPRRSIGTSCATCGYDLRASPDRCPECGRAVPRKSAVLTA
jgi:hypothetical protein